MGMRGAVKEQAATGPGLQSTTACRGGELPNAIAEALSEPVSHVLPAETFPNNSTPTAASPTAGVASSPLEAPPTVAAVTQSLHDAAISRPKTLRKRELKFQNGERNGRRGLRIKRILFTRKTGDV